MENFKIVNRFFSRKATKKMIRKMSKPWIITFAITMPFNFI
jgi:hypothetical protein